jgi:hypothetical protein
MTELRVDSPSSPTLIWLDSKDMAPKPAMKNRSQNFAKSRGEKCFKKYAIAELADGEPHPLSLDKIHGESWRYDFLALCERHKIDTSLPFDLTLFGERSRDVSQSLFADLACQECKHMLYLASIPAMHFQYVS